MRIIYTLKTTFFVVLLTMHGSIPSPALSASFHSLGFLPGGSSLNSKANAISADGSTIVGMSKSSNGFEAFRWTAESGMTGLGDLAGGGFRSIAYGVSADGSVVVGQSQNEETPANVVADSEAFRWTVSGGMQSLGNLPENFSGSRANAISDDGSIIVGIANADNDHDGEAFHWTATTGMVGMGDLRSFGATISTAWGISGDGTVIAGETAVDVGRQAFSRAGTSAMVALGSFPGEGTWDRATAISRDGQVIVGIGNFFSNANNTEAFRWSSASGFTGLGDLPGGSFGSEATAVSGDGSVIVGASSTDTTTPFGNEAFLWTPVAGMRDLRQMVETDFGIDLSGWTLTEATGISADGQTITGYGYNPSGNREAWVISLAVPEPTSACLALIACFLHLAARSHNTNR